MVLLVPHFIAVMATAQNQFSKWYFGQGAALDFSSGSPMVLSGSMIYTNEGSATMSDATSGTLLLYTDGVTVWDRTHSQMPNGFGLSGDVTTTQSALIVQQPGNDSLYYVFTVPADGALTDLRYSIVDMSLNGGLGDVAVKNSFLAAGDTIAEKATAIRHCNGKDWWVIFHALGNNHYLAWKLDSLGLGAFPVVSSVGTVITLDLNQGLGWLTSSNAATRLALPSYSGGTLDIVDFDNQTGMVSNPTLLNGFTRAYGTAFSPNDQVLYVTDEMSLAQFDLSSGVAATIQASRIDIVTEANMLRAIRLGPDAQLYVVREWEPYLGTVLFPDALGFACNYTAMGVNLSPGFNSLGLPNTYSLTVANPCPQVGVVDAGRGMEVHLSPQPVGPQAILEVSLAAMQEVQVSLHDLCGKLAWERRLTMHAGTNRVEMELQHLAGGMYLLSVSSDESLAAKKIIKH